jgi:hypothetical protein
MGEEGRDVKVGETGRFVTVEGAVVPFDVQAKSERARAI